LYFNGHHLTTVGGLLPLSIKGLVSSKKCVETTVFEIIGLYMTGLSAANYLRQLTQG
jgi:hypothetical protein